MTNMTVTGVWRSVERCYWSAGYAEVCLWGSDQSYSYSPSHMTPQTDLTNKPSTTRNNFDKTRQDKTWETRPTLRLQSAFCSWLLFPWRDRSGNGSTLHMQ